MWTKDCEAYKTLAQQVKKDEDAGNGDRCSQKLAWIVERAEHYAEKTGLTPEAVLSAWESRRTYWYMNYYQDANQPLIESESVRVFETPLELMDSIGKEGFRCPHCNGISKSPYACDSGLKVKLMSEGAPVGICNWKVYGLFGHMGKGVYVFVKSELQGEAIFNPIAWETTEEPLAAS